MDLPIPGLLDGERTGRPKDKAAAKEKAATDSILFIINYYSKFFIMTKLR